MRSAGTRIAAMLGMFFVPVFLFGLSAASMLAASGLALELLVAHGVLSRLPLEEIGMSWRLGLATIGFATHRMRSEQYVMGI